MTRSTFAFDPVSDAELLHADLHFREAHFELTCCDAPPTTD